MIARSFFLALFIFFLPTSASLQGGRLAAPAKNGMVVSSQYLGSEAGRMILEQGGNAVDAAVATAFALAVTFPSAGNIGGGGFLVYHGAGGHKTGFNFREKAPLAATADMFLGPDGKVKDNSNHDGALSVGVPGTVAGLYLAHQKLGSLPWEQLLEPAVKLASEGIPASWQVQPFLKYVMENKDRFPSTAKVFLKDGEMYEPGETWVQSELAETMRRIQKNGRDGFYKGETADLFVEYMKNTGGIITHEDLAGYEAEEVELVHGTYRGYDVYGMPPPSSGGVTMIEMLNILEGFNLSEMGHNSALYLHILTEAMRRAYSDRALHLGDPNFNPDMPLDRLTSKEYADEVRSTISMFDASMSDSSEFSSIYMAPESEETTHFSVVDKDGNAVSLTYTLEYSYGSRMVVEGAGFLLNNEMGDFNPIPGTTTTTGLIGTPPNLVEPQKRMLSSMSPSIVVKDNKPFLVIGSPGGRTIINTTLQVILNVIDHDMSVAQAVESPRIHHQWLPDVTRFERWGFSPDTKRLYEMMGHEIQYRNMQGQAMGILIDHETGLMYGASDSRAYDGSASGY